MSCSESDPKIDSGSIKFSSNEALNESVDSLTPLTEESSVDVESLQQRLSELVSIGPINSIVISKQGEIVGEQYFRGMNANRTHNIKSASKSILSLLIGIAIEKGYIQGLDQPISDYFPEYFEANPDSVKASITIADLLTMRAGLESTSGSSYGRWVTSPNWVNHVLNRPLTGTPGIDRIYSTGTTHLLSVILTKASGMSTLAFSNRYLFSPLNIQIGGWDRDPQGFYLGGNNMALKPRDMIKIGQLMMDVGYYNGESIVSADWIIRSVIPVTGRLRDVNYGYLWFRRMAGNYQMVYAWGNGGQFIFIIPEIQSVIVVTSQNISGVPRSYRTGLMTILDTEIVPMISGLR